MASSGGGGGSGLFACSRCYSRHPFEELSAGQQLCKSCRTSNPPVKCTYCRTEFLPKSTTTTSPVCPKCEQNMKTYGKPGSCIYCNVLAAFIGNKCQRCTNSEKKYGPPVVCEGCKQQCAFERGDDDKKVEGKNLCWLCTLSYKRALAKSKSSDKARDKLKRIGGGGGGGGSSHHKSSSHHHHQYHDKRPHRPDVTKLSMSELSSNTASSSSPSSAHHHHHQNKQNKQLLLMDDNSHNCSDHLVALTQLREQISSLTRQLQQKDKELMAKDRQITELKAANFTTEKELRNKLMDAQRDYENKVENMNIKLKQLQKELAVKSKASNNNASKQKSSLTIVSRNNNNKGSDDSNNDDDD